MQLRNTVFERLGEEIEGNSALKAHALPVRDVGEFDEGTYRIVREVHVFFFVAQESRALANRPKFGAPIGIEKESCAKVRTDALIKAQSIEHLLLRFEGESDDV